MCTKLLLEKLVEVNWQPPPGFLPGESHRQMSLGLQSATQ